MILKAYYALSVMALLSACSPSGDEQAGTSASSASASPTIGNAPAASPTEKTSKPRPTLIGEWAELDRECAIGPLGDGNGDGSGDDIANMEISADSYGGYEWGCDLKPKVGNASAYSGKAICYSEGEPNPPMRISFEIMPDGKLKMTTPEGKTVMKRCK